MISVKFDGGFEKTNNFLKKAMDSVKSSSFKSRIRQIAEQGVRSLSDATPKDTGKTAASWSYSIEESNGKTVVSWSNSNVVKGVNIAIILQYGHGTRNGGYVAGIDYVNPAMRDIFDKMSADMWKAVVSS